MSKSRLLFQILSVVTFSLVAFTVANAQATRTWVSGVGDDANPCSRTAPCKTFAGAISKTAACGEIDALDPGGFGQVTITKSITIDGTGTLAGILASSVNGIIVNAGDNDVVTLRGLSINGACTGLNGVHILSAKTVNIEDSVIFGFTGNGINIAESNGVQVNVRNSVSRENTGDGISATTANGFLAHVSITNSSFSGNGNGVHAKANSRVTANSSTFTGNGIGINSDAATVPFFAVINVQNSQITLNNNFGVQANGAAGYVRLSGNQIANNTNNGVIEVGGGNVESFQNNSINGNGVDGCAGCSGLLPG